METYLKRLADLSTEAETQVILPLIEEHKEIVFLDEDDDEMWENLYNMDLPVHFEVSKHGFYIEYAILRAGLQDGTPSVYCVERGEGSGAEWVSLSQLSCETMLWLADYLLRFCGQEKLN